MREQVTDKIKYFYGDRIESIESLYDLLFDIEYNVTMIGVSNIMSYSTGEEGINLNNTIGYNSKLILPEIFDDLSCSLELIKSAYFKQSNQILRNTLELITQLIYSEYLLRSNMDSTPWIKGERGVENIFEITKTLKKVVSVGFKAKLKEIEKFYNLLNQSTHSHKNQLNTNGIAKFDKFGVYGFEYSYFHNAFSIHLCCLDLVIESIKYFYTKFPEDFHKTNLLEKVNSICEELNLYRPEIENYKKGDYEKGEGYLIYRKHMNIKGDSILYSYKANNTIIWASKTKGKKSDLKLIKKAIDIELVKRKIARP
ncbi:hypothetical protein NAT51_03660 [Flavobacterium amniphilum]|uniref:hypothetical protein n=1 Tax=Flavobacterium amniphilum TaxID=1834035 RepID=UPI002029C8DD|nr:hypothetical protein [Flavobacterium amniphilum]MCL9804603.1 hypothetical protein [Flavobacterium amniphilum]